MVLRHCPVCANAMVHKKIDHPLKQDWVTGDAFNPYKIVANPVDLPLVQVYDKLKFKRQEESVLAGDCSQVLPVAYCFIIL